MHACISYFLLDIRANQCGCAWVPWSIDSFEKYSNFVYFTCIISSHLRMYLLFSFGCSGEQVRPFVSSLKYRFLWKIEYLPILYIRNIISCTYVSAIFLWMFGRTSVAVREFPEVKIPSKNTVTSCTLHAQYHLLCACICYFLLDVRADQPDHSWVPWNIDSFEEYSSF